MPSTSPALGSFILNFPLVQWTETKGEWDEPTIAGYMIKWPIMIEPACSQ